MDLTTITTSIILAILANLLTPAAQRVLARLSETWRSRSLKSQENYLEKLRHYRESPTDLTVYVMSVNLGLLVSIITIPLLVLLAGLSYVESNGPLLYIGMATKLLLSLLALTLLVMVARVSIDAMAILTNLRNWEKTEPRLEKMIAEIRRKQTNLVDGSPGEEGK